MSRDTPRGFQLIRRAITDVDRLAELEKLRALAREQWRDDPRLAELEALLDKRAAELRGDEGPQIPLELALPMILRDAYERMMDEIAAADSVAEVEWLRKQIRWDFSGHPRLADLEAALEARMLALRRGAERQGS